MPELLDPIESSASHSPAAPETLPHELLEAKGYECVRSEVYPDLATAERALASFQSQQPGTPSFAKVYDEKSFTIVPYGGGFVIYGKKSVHSAFANSRRNRRTA